MGMCFGRIRVCMNGFLGQADPDDAVETILEFATEGRIDDPAHLGADQIYLFHGEADDTVARASMEALRQVYACAWRDGWANHLRDRY